MSSSEPEAAAGWGAQNHDQGAQNHDQGAVGCVSHHLSHPRLQEVPKQPDPHPGESLQYPDDIRNQALSSAGHPKLPVPLPSSSGHCLFYHHPCISALHGIEARSSYHDYLTQDRLNVKLRSQKVFSVLWHPWLEEEVDVCCSSQLILPCSCFQSFCWSFSLCWLDLHQLASFCRAHRFLLRPPNYMFDTKHRNRQNTSPCFAKS